MFYILATGLIFVGISFISASRLDSGSSFITGLSSSSFYNTKGGDVELDLKFGSTSTIRESKF